MFTFHAVEVYLQNKYSDHRNRASFTCKSLFIAAFNIECKFAFFIFISVSAGVHKFLLRG